MKLQSSSLARFLRSLKRKALTRDFTAEIKLISIILIAYCLNRFCRVFDWVFPFEFTRFYLNDLLGGIFFPSYVNAVLALSRYPHRVRSFAAILIIELFCSVIWEGFAPLLIERSTGDLLDNVLLLWRFSLFFVLQKCPNIEIAVVRGRGPSVLVSYPELWTPIRLF